MKKQIKIILFMSILLLNIFLLGKIMSNKRFEIENEQLEKYL